MKKILLKKQPLRPPTLRFSPTAWAKLLFLRDASETEIGAFGIAEKDDLLFVSDILLPNQNCTSVTVEFDDDSVANFFDEQVDAGRRPEEFARLWMHTHPGNSAEPSATDEATFSRVFGRSDWAVMFILARQGQSYARLRFNVGPGIDVKIPIEIDYNRPFAASDSEGWKREYLANVRVPPAEPLRLSDIAEPNSQRMEHDDFLNHWWRDSWGEYADFDQTSSEADYGYVRDF